MVLNDFEEDSISHFDGEAPTHIEDFDEAEDAFLEMEIKDSPATTKEIFRTMMDEISYMMKNLTRQVQTSRNQTDKHSSITCHEDTEHLYTQVKKKQEYFLRQIKEIQINDVLLAAEVAEKVDLAFIIDCTSSMKPHINDVKVNIKRIVQQIRKCHHQLRLRLAIVGYRDISDGDGRFEVFDFTSDIDVFERQLSSLKVFGGADIPEDMAGAVNKANTDLSWSQPTRLAFFIADAPCHGSEFHDYQDKYPLGTPGIDIKDELHTLSKKFARGCGSMSLYFGRITEGCNKMIASLQSNGIDIKSMNMTESGDLISSVTTSVRNAIFKSMTVSGRLPQHSSIDFSQSLNVLAEEDSKTDVQDVKKKLFSITEETLSHLDWEDGPPCRVKVYRNRSIRSTEQLKKPISVGMFSKIVPTGNSDEVSTMLMRRAKEPFAEGEQRIAFHAKISTEAIDLGSQKSAAVLKTFKHIGRDVNYLNKYLEPMETSSIAAFLAKKYNESPLRPKNCAAIEFLQVCVVEEEATGRDDSGERRFCAESLLDTKKYPFTRFSNNLGYWDEEILNESLLRFTKWTHTITDGYLVVTDLQGIKKENSFTLSDPAILCIDPLRFGGTNLGLRGIHKCMQSTTSLLAERGWLQT